MKPGLSFEEIIRGSLERGDFPAYAGREQAFIDDRFAAHREGKGRPIMVRAVSGRWAQTRDYRLPDGSTVVVRTDVTELVDRENALQDYHSRLDLALRTAGSAYWELDLSNRTHRLVCRGRARCPAPHGRRTA